jgi:hypothetical protein
MAVESLERYPDNVLEELANPKMGIVTKSTFIPSIAEMRTFCDRIWNRIDPPSRASISKAPLQLSGPSEDKEAKEAERKKVIQGFGKLIAELQSKPETFRTNQISIRSKVEEKAAAEVWLAQKAEHAKTEVAPKLSEAALKAYYSSVSGGQS